MLHCCCNDSTLACCSVMRSAFCNFLIYDGEEEGSDLDEDESVTLNEVHACTVNTHTRSRHLENAQPRGRILLAVFLAAGDCSMWRGLSVASAHVARAKPPAICADACATHRAWLS